MAHKAVASAYPSVTVGGKQFLVSVSMFDPDPASLLGACKFSR